MFPSFKSNIFRRIGKYDFFRAKHIVGIVMEIEVMGQTWFQNSWLTLEAKEKLVHDLSVVSTVVDDPLQNVFDLLLELETISEEVTTQTRFGTISFSTLELYNLKRVFKSESYKSNCFSKALPERSLDVFSSPLFSCAV